MRLIMLISSTRSLGAKTKLAARLGRWHTVGADLVHDCVNDTLAQGGRPLFFNDYIAGASLPAHVIGVIRESMADACGKNAVKHVGGETAALPGVYEPGEIELTGTMVGRLTPGVVMNTSAERGDVLIGLPSNGLHAQGYAMALRVLEAEDWDAPHPELGGAALAEILLMAQPSYLGDVVKLWDAGITPRALVHVTGGGMIENLQRFCTPDVGVRIKRGTWDIPPIFGFIQRKAMLMNPEMYRVYNMGVGLIVIVPADQAVRTLDLCPTARRIGEMVQGTGVQLT